VRENLFFLFFNCPLHTALPALLAAQGKPIVLLAIDFDPVAKRPAIA
jgi:hypothetical protein